MTLWTTDGIAKRFENLHPNARETRLKRCRPTAKYVSANWQEYTIEIDQTGYFRIVRYGNGASSLKGRYTSFAEAERDLINFLRRTDKFGKAIWPGRN